MKSKKIRHHKSKNLILKSGFKNSIKNFPRLVGLAIMVTITFIAAMSVVVTNKRISKSYNELASISVQHDFIVDVSNSPRVTFKEEQWIGGENIDAFNNQDLFEQYLLNVLSRKGVNNDGGTVSGENYFNWSRTETRNFYNLKNGLTDLNVKAIVKSSLVDESNDQTSTGEVQVDKIVLDNKQSENIFDKDKDKARRQVVLQNNFARRNNIKVGDIIRLAPDNFGNQLLVSRDVFDLTFGGSVDINNDKFGINNSAYKEQNWFQVIGFGTSADFAYPAIGTKNIIPSSLTDMIAYVDPVVFGLTEQKVRSEEGKQIQLYSYDLVASKLSVSSEEDREIYFSGKFINKPDNITEYLASFNNEWVRYGNMNSANFNLFYELNDPGYKWSMRTSTFGKVMFAYRLASALIIILISLICIFTISLIVKKQFDDAKSKLGTFKAMGYSDKELIMYFISTPIIITTIGLILGYLAVVLTQDIVATGFLNYFNVLETKLSLFPLETILIFVIVFLITYAVTSLIGYSVIEQNALILLQGNVVKKTSRFWRFVKWFFRKSRPGMKLHIALTIGSLTKIIGTSCTLLLSSFLIAVSLTAPEILYKNKSATFKGLNYSGIVEYSAPVANNPLTFLKTYNPNKSEEWNYDKKNIVTEVDDTSNDQRQYYTAYPLIKYEVDKYKYDSNYIVEDILNNNISRNYYSYNIPIANDGDYSSYYEYAKLNYSNWKNLSTDYLKMLDEVDFEISDENGLPYETISSLTKQWTDYKYLIDDIETAGLAMNSTAGEENYLTTLKNVAASLQNFYKKYRTGIPISINADYFQNETLQVSALQDIDWDKQLIEQSTNSLYDYLEVRSPIMLAASGNKQLLYSLKDTQKWEQTLREFVGELNTDNGQLNFSAKNIDNIDLQDVTMSADELLKFNTYLMTWYWIYFEGKVGTMILESNYQSSNSVIQNNIIESLKYDKNYNLTSNIVPFDSENEELGTLVNGIFESNNKSHNIRIFGVNEYTRAFDLVDDANVNITENLFKPLKDEYEGMIPIIINQTVAKKLGATFKSEINFDVAKSLLLDHNDIPISYDQIQMGVQQPYEYVHQTSNDLISEAKKNYYAYNGQNKGWASDSEISVASIGGYKIAADSVSGLTGNTEILDAVNSSQIKREEVYENQKFIVVGVADNYGDSKAWISNDNANIINGFSEAQKYLFKNFFINEWRGSPALSKYYDNTTMPDISNEEWTTFLQYWELLTLRWSDAPDGQKYLSGADNPLDDFKISILQMSDSADEELLVYKKAANYLMKMFNNLYPVFNYKSIITGDYDDVSYSSIKTQNFGDFSTAGLVGTSHVSVDENGISTIIYTQGHAESGLLSASVISDKKQALESVQMLSWYLIGVIMVIVLLISLIIITITTSLIIEENAQFIATMKILGYSNSYVMKQVTSIYILPIFMMYLLGYAASLLFVYQITNYISLNYDFVVPWSISYFVPGETLVVIILVYVITLAFTYKRFTKIKPTDSLQISS